MQQPRIVTIPEKKLTGMNTITTLTQSTTGAMWRKFMPRRNEIKHRTGDYLVCMQIFRPGMKMEEFTPDTPFQSWATVEVSQFEETPEGMGTHTIPPGLYAVFIHKGANKTFHETSKYIFDKWMRESIYEVDDREHFEILGSKYLGPENEESEEEIWIPIRLKTGN